MFSRNKKLYMLSVVILVTFFISTCSKDESNPPVSPPQQESVIKTVGTNEDASVSTPSGIKIEIIAGSVPPNQDNSNAKVTFSIESPVDPPTPIPSPAVVKGNVIRLGPDAFIFRWPIRILLPYPDGTNTEQLKILHYNTLLSKWIIVPASYIEVNKRVIGADVLELGYYALATISFSKRMATDSEGGFEYGGEPGFYYSLTVRSVTFKYPAQATWYNLVGQVAGSTGSEPTGGPRPPTHARLPQGTYEIWITKTKPGTLSELPKQWTYTIPATGTIAGPLSYWGMGNETGWTTLSSPGGGDWKEGIPSNWPQPTKPMGTGEFQATLTWVNTPSRIADMDLHLYGPLVGTDSLHVYWSEKLSPDGSLQLDRDWQDEEGNAVENIFSLKQIPKGTYVVKVRNFAGATMSFNLRIIRFGSVKTYSSSLQEYKETAYETFVVN